jgi:hypothetical protein
MRNAQGDLGNRSFETPLSAAPQDGGCGCYRTKDLMLRRLQGCRLEALGLQFNMRERRL